jgi:hypothetical protein
MRQARWLAAGLAASVLLVPAADAAKKKPPYKTDAFYTGSTNQGKVCHGVTDAEDDEGQPCSAVAIVNADRTAELSIKFRAPCDDGFSWADSFLSDAAQITGSRFRTSYDATRSYSSGASARFQASGEGVFKRSKKGKYSASGRLDVIVDYTPATGETMRCRVPVGWSAKFKDRLPSSGAA